MNAISEMWRRARLGYLLHEGQDDLRKAFYESSARIFVMLCSRRYGKSFLGTVLGVEAALSRPGAQVRIAAPTSKNARSIIEPHMRTVLGDCPELLRPQHRRNEGMWEFPEPLGSEIHLSGCDSGNAERLRGADTLLGLVEEAGFVDDLEYVVNDILLPQTLTTNGRVLLISSPPRSPAHPLQRFCVEAEAEGALVRRTIYDAPHITPAQIEEYCRRAGGENSTTWRREYLSEFVTESTVAVVPEFPIHEKSVVGAVERPSHFKTYITMDVGFSDLTVALFAYAHFDLGRLVVEDEVVLRQATSSDISEAVMAKEHELWPGIGAGRRLVDAPLIVTHELSKAAGLTWSPVRKDNADAALARMRRAIQEHRLLIHPRCKTLIAHLRGATWNKSRTNYTRSGTFGHFDAVDALKYLVRHGDINDNPYPNPRSLMSKNETWFRPEVTSDITSLMKPAWKR